MEGEEAMSEEWVTDTIKQIKQSEEDKPRRESYALLCERKLDFGVDVCFVKGYSWN
jgi:hypothetical protein